MVNKLYGSQRISIVHSEEWPPECCVAAFVFRALNALGYQPKGKRDLALALGTKVMEGSSNPWSLPITSDINESGVSIHDASTNIPIVLNAYNIELNFAHLPLKSIPYELYMETLRYGNSHGCVMGVGFDASYIYDTAASEIMKLKHVAQVLCSENNESDVVLVDETLHPENLRNEISWIILEKAILSIYDGFWILGQRNIVEKIRNSWHFNEII
jgi:hypothetical protein